MKARFKYRIYPKPHQILPLAKAFGCARVVWNDALAIYKKAWKEGKLRPKNVDKRVITQAKKTEERAWLSDVWESVIRLHGGCGRKQNSMPINYPVELSL